MSLTFDSEKHLYLDGKQELTSVTQLLAAIGVTKDLSHLDPIYRRRGTAVHQIMELIFEDDYSEADTDESLHWYGNQIQQWKADTGFQPKIWELQLANRKQKVAGTLDVAGLWRDEIHIADGKTGVIVEVAVACQLAGYEELALRGEVIENKDYDRDFLKYMRAHPEKIRRKSLNLKDSGPYTYRSHDEPHWPGRWKSCVVYHAMMSEYGLLKKRERVA